MTALLCLGVALGEEDHALVVGRVLVVDEHAGGQGAAAGRGANGDLN